ncbi:MAG TPA: hypothetical protein VFM83_11135 [Gaiellaceae bacterium]|nr:hypothetical protein [Gaiellaceae bacterium]
MADDSTATTTLQSASGLNLALSANTTYSFEYYILFTSAQANNGIGLALSGPGTPAAISYTVAIPIGNDGTNGLYSGWGTAYDDAVIGSAVPSTGTTYAAHIYGVVRTGATAGNLIPRFRSETNGTSVSVKTYSWGSLSAA